MALAKKVFHPLELELLKHPEDAAVRVTVLDKNNTVVGVQEDFLKDLLTRRGGSSKRPDMLKSKILKTVSKGIAFQVEAI